MADQPGPHHSMADHVFHDHRAHDLVVKINFGNLTGAKCLLKAQNIGFNTPAIRVQSHLLTDAKVLAGLLHDNALAGRLILDAEHIVQVAVADLFTDERSS